MKLGYFGFNMGLLGTPESIVRVARAAEAAGLESIFGGEHVVLQDPQSPPSPMPPLAPVIDQIAALSFAAAHTKTIKLGTGIIILPQRNPVVLAKELASVDVISGGRLIAGFGVGYVEREFDSIGVPFAERGPRTSEHIEVLRALWTQEQPRFDGRFTKFAGIQSRPQPLQKPHPPILVGGMSKSAHRRAVAHANEWYGFFQSVDATAAALRGLEEAAKAVPRPASLGRLGLTVTPPPGIPDRDALRRYEDLGVGRIVLMRDFRDMGRMAEPGGAEEDDVIAFIEKGARTLA
jgi:probable F420-dependent oxidoreductase